MSYIVAGLILLVGLASSAIVETAAELSANEMLDADAGATLAAAPVTADGIVDMRPEASFALRIPAGG